MTCHDYFWSGTKQRQCNIYSARKCLRLFGYVRVGWWPSLGAKKLRHQVGPMDLAHMIDKAPLVLILEGRERVDKHGWTFVESYTT